MRKAAEALENALERLLDKLHLSMRKKLIIIFLIVKLIPLLIITYIAWRQMTLLGSALMGIALEDSRKALTDSAVESIERMSTDIARQVAEFLYERDSDILMLAALEPTESNYRSFVENSVGRVVTAGKMQLSADRRSWRPAGHAVQAGVTGQDEGVSTNNENNDMDRFHHRQPDQLSYHNVPLYDEVTFVGLDGQELIKIVARDSTKVNYPMDPRLKDVSDKSNTYVRAEGYFEKLKDLAPGEIYVSDVIGAYVGSNYIGMYTPITVDSAARERGYPIEYNPEGQAYAGRENPNGQRVEGIVRWAAPVTDDNGIKIGYVTLALNHDHIMEFVDHVTPMNERYTELPSAYEGNYAFIWDYQCRSIAHPRHHSIAGYDPETGEPQVPWLEESIYNAWQEAYAETGVSWIDFVNNPKGDGVKWKEFDEQSRSKRPAPQLTREGNVGLDGRYLNNAPQCTGWMDLTADGGSGSFYILWSGIYKLNTAAAIPYYTGQYSEAQAGTRRGFGFVAIGSGLEDFESPVTKTETTLLTVLADRLRQVFVQFVAITFPIILVTVFVAVFLASFITRNITKIINGVSRFRAGERQFRFRAAVKDEFGALADSFDEMADSIVSSISGPLTIIDMNYNIKYMNETGLAYRGKTLEEVVGQPYTKYCLVPMGSVYCPITALRMNRDTEVYYLESRDQYIKPSASYLFARNNEKTGYIIISTDVTEIENERKRAQNASQAKGNFLSNMSHEIRTPLNAIIGMTSIGKQAADLERKDYAFGKIENASTHLLGVVNDILDMSKIEADKFELSPLEFNFEKMLQKVVNVINFRMEEKNQNFSVHIDKDIPSILIGDDQRLSQVITNLLSNAVKFTPDGGSIRLDTRLLAEGDGRRKIQIEVTDSGIGVSEEQRQRLFTAFGQAESSTSRKFGGTGLGLAISKRIVEMMDGRIWIESKLGRGSKFAFYVWLAVGTEEPYGEVEILNQGALRMMAVDDSAEVLQSFKEISRRFGFECDVAESGAAALELIRGQHYDIYFIALRLLGMDGLELAARIRKVCGERRGHVVMIISSSDINAIAGSPDIDKFLTRPLFPSAITDCINEYLREDAEKEAAPSSDDINGFEGFRALLAEDVEINREILLALAEPTGLEIDCAVNGAEAVRMYTEAPERYHIIFMDMQMPEMDGLEAARRIRASGVPGAEDVPIVAMTANVFREDIEKCLAAGMNDHVGKPIDFDDVLAKLRLYLKQNQA
ncbi:MAG: response regulator [Clostridiales bacterium]|nr:response regulator [Clostridiales bacterium]